MLSIFAGKYLKWKFYDSDFPMQTSCLGKLWFTSCKSKCFCSVRVQGSWSSIAMEGIVWYRRFFEWRECYKKVRAEGLLLVGCSLVCPVGAFDWSVRDMSRLKIITCEGLVLTKQKCCILNIIQSWPYKNHCDFYKRLASRLWPVLLTLTDFFLLYTLSSSAAK